MLFLRLGIVLLTSVNLSTAATWPNHVIDELEHLLVDTDGFNDAGFQKAITPCSNYVSGSQLLGRETAAQWIRVAFHDFATADVKAGTGGVDASIGFETLRPENSGAAMNDSLGFFAPFVNAHASTTSSMITVADMIALSIIMSVGTCSNPTVAIPLRGGRIDATEGGSFGVPEPETDIETTLNQFSLAGFSQSDAIGLTICGHTLGSVHHAGFPQVVPESAVTPNNTGGGIHFDATPDVFDVDVLNEYLEWKGQRGGPLVTTDNVTVRSDLRLYLSDNNATLQGLAESSSTFRSTCASLLTRMINTTPASTQLTDVIDPIEVKPVNVSLTVGGSGELHFSGYIRLLSAAFQYSDEVVVSWTSRAGSSSPGFNTRATAVANGNSSMFGETFYHFFNTSIDPSAGISAFNVTILRGGSAPQIFSNGGGGYPMEDVAIFLPHETTIASNGSISMSAVVLTAANAQNVSATISAPSPQLGTLSPTIVQSVVAFEKSGTRGLYTTYSATLPPVSNLRQTTLDLTASGDRTVYRDEFRRITL
ncbi:heme peroxidase [Mycena metata]|uniref:Peroxidase n=1 Tax=Mycena metata TaxID=1033252 RepID=A0AAD7MH01_9AGAR|nr:heme peroxidase [Mycena metata]